MTIGNLQPQMLKPARVSSANKIGLSERTWEPAEIEVLREWYPKGGYGVLAKKLPKRSKSSVYSMAYALELKTRPVGKSLQFFETEQVAKGMGVSVDTVIQWVKNKGLKTKDREGRQVITSAALRRWIGSHHNHINLARVDRTWFISLAFPSSNNAAIQ